MKKNNINFEEDYFEGYYKGIADFTEKRDKELANWFSGMFSYISRYYPIQKGEKKKVIEFGCASGVVAVLLRDWGWSVTATDISHYAVKKAQKNYKGIRFLIHNMEDPFPQKKFDLALAFDVIEHLPHPEKGVKNTYDLLKKGGKIIFSTPNDYPYVWNDPTHVSVKVPTEWEKMLKKAGFRNIFVKQIALFPYLYRLHRMFSFALPFAINSPYIMSPVILIAEK